MFRRAEPFYYAFDILWDEHARSDEKEMRRFRNGEDTRYLPLTDRKLRLRRVVRKRTERLLYCDDIEENGEALFKLACERDLEGIVAKRKGDPYLPEYASWLKIRNRTYSQWIGRATSGGDPEDDPAPCGTDRAWACQLATVGRGAVQVTCRILEQTGNGVPPVCTACEAVQHRLLSGRVQLEHDSAPANVRAR
jgi:ATP dependent DNA ligase-like protein